jgi:hypothetical protein
MSKNTYDKGELVALIGIWEDEIGTRIDPNVIISKIKSPSGVISSYVYGIDPIVQRDEIGVYRIEILGDESGDWIYRFESTNTFPSAGEDIFNVKETAF